MTDLIAPICIGQVGLIHAIGNPMTLAILTSPLPAAQQQRPDNVNSFHLAARPDSQHLALSSGFLLHPGRFQKVIELMRRQHPPRLMRLSQRTKKSVANLTRPVLEIAGGRFGRMQYKTGQIMLCAPLFDKLLITVCAWPVMIIDMSADQLQMMTPAQLQHRHRIRPAGNCGDPAILAQITPSHRLTSFLSCFLY